MEPCDFSVISHPGLQLFVTQCCGKRHSILFHDETFHDWFKHNNGFRRITGFQANFEISKWLILSLLKLNMNVLNHVCVVNSRAVFYHEGLHKPAIQENRFYIFQACTQIFFKQINFFDIEHSHTAVNCNLGQLLMDCWCCITSVIVNTHQW